MKDFNWRSQGTPAHRNRSSSRTTMTSVKLLFTIFVVVVLQTVSLLHCPPELSNFTNLWSWCWLNSYWNRKAIKSNSNKSSQQPVRWRLINWWFVFVRSLICHLPPINDGGGKIICWWSGPKTRRIGNSLPTCAIVKFTLSFLFNYSHDMKRFLWCL